MMSAYQKYKKAYDQGGFVIVRQLLTKDEFSELCRNLDRYIREVVPTLSDKHAFYQDRARPETLKQMQFMDVDPYFRDYVKQPQWLSLGETLVGEPVQVDVPQWFNKPPNTNHVTPPHQDNYYGFLFPCNEVTIWMALDVVDDENGCLRYIPGSHRKGFRPHNPSNVLGFSQGISDYGPEDEAREVKIHLQPGDVVVHNGMTIHRADANKSTVRHRRAFAMRFVGASCKRDEAAFARHQAIAKAQHEKMGLKV